MKICALPYLSAFLIILVSSSSASSISSSSSTNDMVKDKRDVAPPPGSDAMKSLFMLADGFRNFNHGSFGSPPRMVIEAQRKYSDECEAYPDRWFRGGYEGYFVTLREKMRQYINALDGDDIVFVENTSSGFNAVLRSLPLESGDVIVELSVAYGMVKNTLAYLHGFNGVEVVQIPVIFHGNSTVPTGKDGISLEAAVNQTLASYAGTVKLLTISQIVSLPGIILPIESVSKIAQSHGVSVFIDGAHALGQVPVDIRALQAAGVDYWVGNGHKWLYSPKGSAVLWVAKEKQESLAPTVISSAFTSGVVHRDSSYLNHFQYTGTRDYTAMVTMLDALSFRHWVGEERIYDYCHKLAVEGQNLLAHMWNTEVLVPEDLTGFMAHVRLPSNDATKCSKLGAELMDKYDMEVVVFPLEQPPSAVAENDQVVKAQDNTNSSWWLRLSAQLYLNTTDFKALGEAVLDLLQ